MNKTIIYVAMLLSMIFVACEPLEDRQTPGGAITADQLNISAKLITVNGKKANKVIVENHSPVLSAWDCGIIASSKHTDTVLLFKKGANEIEFTGLNADGSKITKTINVDVEDMAFPVPPEYAYLFGEGEKTWTWDDTYNGGKPWGNGGYLASPGPAWWTLTPEEINGQVAGEGANATMTFSIRKAEFTKTRNNGTIEHGRFALDLTKQLHLDDGTLWAKGKFKIIGSSILCGVSPEEDKKEVNEFDILELSESRIILAYAPAGTGPWGTAYFWVFRPK